MITKVKCLKNIGKFYDFSSSASAIEWQMATFLFAPNAYGKSTLVNVLRSLHDNNPSLIRARKTLGAAGDPEAVIVVDGATHVFKDAKWNSPGPPIQVFDAPYIHANILAHEISHEHKKSIHKIVIGALGIKLAGEFSELKNAEKAQRQELQRLTDEFKKAGVSLSLEAFLALSPEEEAVVDERIQKLETDIKAKQAETVILQLGLPREVSAPSFDLSVASDLAAKKLAVVHDSAERQVAQHISRNCRDAAQARQFIRHGLELLQADCPFCGQDLTDAASLLEAYRAFFDESFRAYQQGITQQISALAQWNLDNDLTRIISTHHANLATAVHWEPYLGAADLPDIPPTIEECRSRLATLKGSVLAELEKKQRDPNADADLSKFAELAAEQDTLAAAVQGYNAQVRGLAERARAHIAGLPKSDVASLQAALAKEQEIKKRFLPQWKTWATNYPVVRDAAASLLVKKDAKQIELKEYSKAIFTTHQKRINDLLLDLGADFAITGLTGKTDERANESYSDFAFLILEQAVPLTARQDDAPCFKNTLSEGDKSTLAFAFFIAVLEGLPELAKQVVVFDDPLSSLDENRREATARLLMKLSRTVNQVAVFTHKKDFLRMLYEKMPAAKVLQLCSDKKNGSRIMALDMEEDLKGEHARMLEGMERYCNEDFGPSTEIMQGNIRKAFEVVLKTKYYRALAQEIKEKKGFGTLLTKLFNDNVLDPSLKQDLFDLCNVTNGPHHGEIVDATSKTLTREELIPLIQRSFKLMEKV